MIQNYPAKMAEDCSGWLRLNEYGAMLVSVALCYGTGLKLEKTNIIKKVINAWK